MRALITGGGGFLGRHVVDQLLARGDTVRVLGRRAYPDLVGVGVECIQADLADAGAVAQACEGMDAVFHIAAKAGIWGRKSEYVAANVTGTRHVLEGCRAAGVSRLVYTSTPSVIYGRHPIEGENESKPYPGTFLTHYAQTKAEAEKMILSANSPDLRTCALRPHLIWGPGDTNLLPRIVARARARRLRRIGEGVNRVSVCYVENGAAAHLAACDHLSEGGSACGQAYFINEKEPVNCWDFIERLLETVGAPKIRGAVSQKAAYGVGACLEALYTVFGITSEPPMTRFLALQLSTSHWFHIGKARRDLGWSPQISIEEGLRRTANSFRPTGSPQ